MNESNILAAKSIIGDKVRNNEGEDLGSVKELLIDPQSGKVEYGVISYGGLMGMGTKEIAVPYEAFTPIKENDYFILNVDRETFENASSQIEYDGKSYYIY
jgi:sporulation protein YlmC with PRC-barrel domain